VLGAMGGDGVGKVSMDIMSQVCEQNLVPEVVRSSSSVSISIAQFESVPVPLLMASLLSLFGEVSKDGVDATEDRELG
jgi:hypothetical protein